MGKAAYIVIAGGGRVGSHLLKLLTSHDKNIDLVIIEKDQIVCEKLAGETNALVINGDATSKEILEDAKIQNADVFAAVTGNDNENIVACQLAKYSYKVPLVMARVDDLSRAEMLRGLGIDLFVSPSEVAAMVFENAIALPGTTSILVSKTVTRAVEITVPENMYSVIGKPIKQLLLPAQCVIAAIYRGGDLIIPHGDTKIKAGDIVAVIGKEDAIKKVLKILKGR